MGWPIIFNNGRETQTKSENRNAYTRRIADTARERPSRRSNGKALAMAVEGSLGVKTKKTNTTPDKRPRKTDTHSFLTSDNAIEACQLPQRVCCPAGLGQPVVLNGNQGPYVL